MNFVKKIRTWTEQVFRENVVLILILFVSLFLPTAVYVLNLEIVGKFACLSKLVQASINAFTLSFFAGAVFSVFRFKPFMKWVTASLMILLSIIELYIVCSFDSTYTPTILSLALKTDFSEAKEFLSSYVEPGTVFLILLCAVICCCIISFCKIKLKNNSIMRNTPPHLPYILIFILSAGVFLFAYRLTSPFTFYRSVTPIHRFGVSLKAAIEVEARDGEIEAYRKENPVKLTYNEPSIQNIVLIIGESLNRDHMSLYGYPLETTPRLDSLHKHSHLFKFSDIVTSSPSTFVSITNMLTFSGVDSKYGNLWYTKGILPDIMKAAGYRTYWISNQSAPFLNDHVCDIVHYRNDPAGNDRNDSHDEVLLGLLKGFLSQTDSVKHFFIVHLQGSHFLYDKRYPRSFERFTAQDAIKGETAKQKKCVAEYDNSVYYNDYVVSSIMEMFGGKESLVCYVPDHGEEVHDFRDFFGRSPSKVTRYMLEIPMLMYVSDSLSEKKPDLLERIRKSLDNPYETDDLIHTILDLSDVHTESYEPARSIVHPSFNKGRKRMINEVDYDAVLRYTNHEAGHI